MTAHGQPQRGDPNAAVNLLLRGAAKAGDPQERAELYFTLGTHLHDHRIWESSYWAFIEALKISEKQQRHPYREDNDNNNNSKHNYNWAQKMALRAACQVLYLGHYLAEWDLVDRVRLPSLARLSVSLGGSPLSAVAKAPPAGISSLTSNPKSAPPPAPVPAYLDSDMPVSPAPSTAAAAAAGAGPTFEPQLSDMRGPELHPWISILLPMPPPLRLQIAHRFWQALRAQTLAPVAVGGLGVKLPRIAPPEHPSRQVFDFSPSFSSSPSASATRSVNYASLPRLQRRLRVGFASADFKQKATSYLCLGQFQYFDRSRIEVFLYASTADPPGSPSKWRRQLQQGVDHFRELHPGKMLTKQQQQELGLGSGSNPTMNSAAASSLVAADDLDVFVDLDGYSNEGLRRSELFAVRHAPVTVAWFVYMSTLGNPEVDYIVGDPVAIPRSVRAAPSVFLLLPHPPQRCGGSIGCSPRYPVEYHLLPRGLHHVLRHLRTVGHGRRELVQPVRYVTRMHQVRLELHRPLR